MAAPGTQHDRSKSQAQQQQDGGVAGMQGQTEDQEQRPGPLPDRTVPSQEQLEQGGDADAREDVGHQLAGVPADTGEQDQPQEQHREPCFQRMRFHAAQRPDHDEGGEEALHHHGAPERAAVQAGPANE